MIFIDIVFISIFLILFLYRFVDKWIFFCSVGKKLQKISPENQNDINSNLVSQNNNVLSKIFFSRFNLPQKIFFIFNTFIQTISLFLFKISITYKFLSFNFIYLKIFSKNICLNQIFKNELIFKVLYLLESFIFILIIVLKINLKVANVKLKKENKRLDNNDLIYLGKTVNNEIYIPLKGLYQNILITGSIGSGKTSTAINNIVTGLISKSLTGIIIDIKGNYYSTLEKICKKYNVQKKVEVISLNSSFKYNPLASNISNFEKAADIKKILNIISNGKNTESFWLDKVEMYTRAFLCILEIAEEKINFKNLNDIICKKDFLNELLLKAKENILTKNYTEDKVFEFNNAFFVINNEYFNLDSRTKNIINAEITRITNIFSNDYGIYNSFCTSNDRLIFDEKIYILSLNFGENMNLTKIIATYLKLEFQRFILSNKSNKPIFFVADEFQEIVNAEDANFFSLSREYNCINVVAVQSYSSIYNSLNNEKTSDVIIQNFVNKIWFRNDDLYTIEKIIKQIGKINRIVKNSSYSENGNNSKYSFITKNFKSYKTSISKSYNYNNIYEYKYSEKFFSQDLKTFEAMCLISDGYNINLFEKVNMKNFKEDDKWKLK